MFIMIISNSLFAVCVKSCMFVQILFLKDRTGLVFWGPPFCVLQMCLASCSPVSAAGGTFFLTPRARDVHGMCTCTGCECPTNVARRLNHAPHIFQFYARSHHTTEKLTTPSHTTDAFARSGTSAVRGWGVRRGRLGFLAPHEVGYL